MSKTIIPFLIAVIFLTVTACDTAKKVGTVSQTPETEPVYRELIEMISKQPGVQVKKVGGNYDITIRSKATFITSHQPLFVVDGLALGTNYADVANSILITDVQKIGVLRGSEATHYGSRGANGVIEIYLKKGNR